VPATAILVTSNRVSQVKTVATDGYRAAQLTSGVRSRRSLTQPLRGHFSKAAVEPGRSVVEFRLDDEPERTLAPGEELGADLFAVGDLVDIRGVTKGRGFSGGIRRHHFRGQDTTHGNSLSHRAPGSIGQCQTPGRVFKGKRMAGQLGAVSRSQQNLRVLRVDVERNLLIVKGSIPGSAGAEVVIRPAVKARANRGLIMELSQVGGNGQIEVDDQVFAADYNSELVHQVVTAYLAEGRAGTKGFKGRSDVAGSGSKPYRQKGTGRARAGSVKSPIWRGGGKTFAPKPTATSRKVNKKMYRGAMRSILSRLVKDSRLTAIDEFDLKEAKTKRFTEKARSLGFEKALIVVSEVSENLRLASRNSVTYKVVAASRLDPVSAIRFEHVVATEGALRTLEERFK
jgi:large subunit ribosomal protein L3